MRAGLLKEVICVGKPVVTKNEYGEKVQSYNYDYTTRANVLDNTGSRAEENGEIVHNYTKSFEVWNYVDVSETDLIKYEDRLYRILSIVNNKSQLRKTILTELVND